RTVTVVRSVVRTRSRSGPPGPDGAGRASRTTEPSAVHAARASWTGWLASGSWPASAPVIAVVPGLSVLGVPAGVAWARTRGLSGQSAPAADAGAVAQEARSAWVTSMAEPGAGAPAPTTAGARGSVTGSSRSTSA